MKTIRKTIVQTHRETEVRAGIFAPFFAWLSRLYRILHGIPVRVDTSELLEQGLGTMDDVKANLREMWRINRWLGGLRALTAHLFPRLRQHNEPLVLADLGSGSGEMAAYLTNRIQREQLSATVLPLEYEQRHLDAAHHMLQT